MSEKKIWFITGVSTGLGRSLAEEVINAGDYVIGTFRQEEQRASFEKEFEGKAEGVILDVTNKHQIDQVVSECLHTHSRIDVLVNNAGFGYVGAIEEAEDQDIRMVIETNLIGALNVTRAFLSQFRKQGSGNILQLSSASGIRANPGFGIYNASKFGLEGFSEALALELRPLGIWVTIVEPGPFRTKFAGSSLKTAPKRIEDYDESAGKFRDLILGGDGKQEGDPVKASKAMINIVNSDNPPLRLILGKVAVQSVQAKIDSLQSDLDAYRTISESVVY